MSRTLVIGDVHGHLKALEALLNAAAPTPADTVIMLGDYIDRGPDTRGVLDRLIALQRSCRLIPLLGNHEEMMLAARILGLPRSQEWLHNGGDKTLESYASPLHLAADLSPNLEEVPADHWLFLRVACREYFETETHIFVHAGLQHDVPLAQQPKHMLRWARFDDPPPHLSGKIMVCGHTPQRSGLPRYLPHALCLDTGIHAGRLLTCLELDSGKIWQANEKGKMRQSHLDEHRA